MQIYGIFSTFHNYKRPLNYMQVSLYREIEGKQSELLLRLQKLKPFPDLHNISNLIVI